MVSSKPNDKISILLEQDDTQLMTTTVVNPATFPATEQAEENPEHDCLQTAEEAYASRSGLKDTPLENPDLELYTDGSSFVQNGKQTCGYAVTISEVMEARRLSSKVSAQKAELIALTRALDLSKGKCVNIWTDSKYVFGVIHAHGAIWKEKGLLTT